MRRLCVVAVAAALTGAALSPRHAVEGHAANNETIPLQPKILGSQLNDWVFTPVPACRALDTRPGSGIQGDGDGPLAPGTPYEFSVVGGGICGVPSTAKAVSINFIAVSAAGNGNLRVWPWDSSSPPQPGTAVITYTFGFNTSNGVVIPICNTQTSTGASCLQDLFAQTNASSSHVVADIFGYFAPPATSGLVRAGAFINGGMTPGIGRSFNNVSSQPILVTRLGVGDYELDFGADVTTRIYVAGVGQAGTPAPTPGQVSVTPRFGNPEAIEVRTTDSAGLPSDSINFAVQIF